MHSLRGLILISIFLICLVVYSDLKAERWTARPSGVEKICGWFDNPTPANAWLTDHHGEWTIAVQGGYQAEGDWPSFSDSQPIFTMDMDVLA
ncbi:MAG TPA: DUF4087 domain-containing protein [Nitrosomonas sp.]|nr:DUF4087 domain-containing protein [Nitrosomonas sp.]HRB33122.1 DUF4087 domain-containing protein [Nitrosomonas sp.]HRB46178.1 DUF4087 domain-containing protein [Nitrosomonas sp.]